MTIDNFEVIDALGLSPSDDVVLLMIFDGWDWTDEWMHLVTLQEKINVYFGFVESGQVYENYPIAVGRQLCIDIIAKFPLPGVGEDFLKQASAAAGELGITIRHKVTP
ncbi:hypothetical protein G3545_08670 [Starkeya sp. ORNL1]|uniref:DUF6572 domain-containing protein n=1 Tax=Starkeya sp. ORNL1 TaxID=2709380 RepID=UPI0014637AAA|nr:DUF6572 domain-containing protein [Starkeya sp. ORNL1]QJP13724.1 hypothetical protein G3545_08670 [Starkeya sp. ORNL1]